MLGLGVFLLFVSLYCLSIFFQSIIIERVETYNLCFLQSVQGTSIFAPVHFFFFVHALGGSRRCSPLRTVRRLGTLKEKPLWSRLEHLHLQTLTALLAGGSSGRKKGSGVEREGNPFNHPNKQQQGLQEWHIAPLLTIAIIH